MKTVISLLLITYVATISARQHPELCGGLQTGVNPCKECDRANIALFGADPQYKSPSYGFPSSNNGAPGYNQIVLTPSPVINQQATCSGPGCGGIGPIIQNTPQQVLGGISTRGMLSTDYNAQAVQTFQPTNDLCSQRRRLSKNNFRYNQKKFIVRPARPSRITCKVENKPISKTFESGTSEYNSNVFHNKKITTALNNVMNKVTHKKIFNGNSGKVMNKFPVFNGDNTALGNIIHKISSSPLMTSCGISNGFSQGNNVYSTNNLNTVAANTNTHINTNTNTHTNTNTNTNFASHKVFSGLTTLISSGQSNNQENTVNTGLKAELLIPVGHTNNNPNVQINNGQSTNGQLIISGQSSNGQFANAQSTNGQVINIQSTTGQGNGQFSNGQFSNGQFSNGQLNNGQFSNGQLNNGQFSNGQLNNGQFSNGQLNNGQFSNGQSTSGNFFDVQSTTGQVNGQFSTGQFNTEQLKDSQSKHSAIVNFIDPSSGNIRAMTRDEFCDDKKLSYEEQEKMYKGEKQTGPVDAVSWQLYLNELLASLVKTQTFQPAKKISEGGLAYGYKQLPVNEYKMPEREIPEEVLHVADKTPLEFKNPAPSVNPQKLFDQLTSSFQKCEPCKNIFTPQSPTVPADTRTIIKQEDVPCGIIGATLPDYRPGSIEESQVSNDYNEGNYEGHSCACI